MGKVLAIYFSDPEPMGYPFNKDEYWGIYQSIIGILEERGVVVYIVRGDCYRGKGKFGHGWRIENGKLKMSTGEIQADLIFNRDDKNTIPRITDCPIINQPDLDELCLDKWATARLFLDLSPMSAYINDFAEWQTLFKKQTWKGRERIVLKKNFQTEGRGIHILPPQNINCELYESWNDILVQEFIDSSVGIPGLADGLHDIRVNVVNCQIIDGFIRVPKAGSFLANVSAGGTGRSIEKTMIPAEVLALAAAINKKLSRYYPSLYTIDFMNSAVGYKLVELNSRPGVQLPNWPSTYHVFNSAIVNMLVGAL